MAVIEIQNLRKYYGKQLGTQDVSFSINEGELFGFVGPNGAGKSTTIKVLLGFLFADCGQTSICGKDSAREAKAIKKFTGYVPSDVRFYENMKMEELLKRNGNFYQSDGYGKEAERLCELFELNSSKRFRELSSGNKKKVAIVCAMASKPKVLILDEPTNGLDPMIQKRLFEELKSQTQRGVTVLLSSHNLAEVQLYCNRVAFIKNGTILTVTDLKEVQPRKKITVHGGDQAAIPDAAVITRANGSCTFRCGDDSNSLITLLGKIRPDDFTVENESIEERFMNLYGQEDSR